MTEQEIRQNIRDQLRSTPPDFRKMMLEELPKVFEESVSGQMQQQEPAEQMQQAADNPITQAARATLGNVIENRWHGISLLERLIRGPVPSSRISEQDRILMARREQWIFEVAGWVGLAPRGVAVCIALGLMKDLENQPQCKA